MDLITVNKSLKKNHNKTTKQWSIRNLKFSQLHPSHPSQYVNLGKKTNQTNPKQRNKFTSNSQVTFLLEGENRQNIFLPCSGKRHKHITEHYLKLCRNCTYGETNQWQLPVLTGGMLKKLLTKGLSLGASGGPFHWCSHSGKLHSATNFGATIMMTIHLDIHEPLNLFFSTNKLLTKFS